MNRLWGTGALWRNRNLNQVVIVEESMSREKGHFRQEKTLSRHLEKGIWRACVSVYFRGTHLTRGSW